MVYTIISCVQLIVSCTYLVHFPLPCTTHYQNRLQSCIEYEYKHCLYISGPSGTINTTSQTIAPYKSHPATALLHHLDRPAHVWCRSRICLSLPLLCVSAVQQQQLSSRSDDKMRGGQLICPMSGMIPYIWYNICLSQPATLCYLAVPGIIIAVCILLVWV